MPSKQSRMYANLFETFDKVIRLGYRGSMETKTIPHHGRYVLATQIIIYDYEGIDVFNEMVIRGDKKYSTYVDELVRLERQLNNRGKKLEYNEEE